MNLQELADLPYAGMAEKKLKEAGKWDEYAGQEEKEWIVTVDIEIKSYETETVKVMARSEEEACEKAELECENDIDVIEAVARDAKEVK